MSRGDEVISVHGARVHNLKNLDVDIPRNQLVVITGLSGSGKSSLAFDTIYAEGQRRYLETFSAYVRQYIGKLVRPEVDDIQGLSPVISIEQKTVNRSPRSTVGTVTEIYDIMRLLFARAGIAMSPVTNAPMVRFSDEEIIDRILTDYVDKKVTVLAPVIRGRKGHYREFFEQITRQGFARVRVDGTIRVLVDDMQLDRYKTHDVEIVVDRINVNTAASERIRSAVRLALKYGKGVLMILEHEHTKPRFFSRNYMCPVSGISYEDPAPNLFSFNSPYGACQRCNGLGAVFEPKLDKIVPDPGKSIADGAIVPLGRQEKTWTFAQLEAIGHKYGFTVNTPWEKIPKNGVDVILNGTSETIEVRNKALGLTQSVHVSFAGLFSLLDEAVNGNSKTSKRRWASAYSEKVTCPRCHGGRLKEESRQFKIRGTDITELAAMNIRHLGDWFDDLENHLDDRQQIIAKEPIKEIRARINFLKQVGIDYLSLNRGSKTLSGGEAQRIRLATQVGSELVGVLYILDEPSIGLHQRDNARLIEALKQLRNQGNSVIVVEHDREIMEHADFIIDMGPGAGAMGGSIVAAGPPDDFIRAEVSTANYLSGKKRIKIPGRRRKGNGKKLIIKGAKGNNLKSIDVAFPLGTVTCVTGVSGSGKSTLLNQTLMPALKKMLYRSVKQPLEFESLNGVGHLDKVVDVDQRPIGRTPRSNPATYTGVFSDIRKLFSMLPDAKARGYKPGRFSFNVKGGRCETCLGAGLRVIQMNFLPDVHVPCEECGGHRYNRETLEIRYKGKSIEDVLNMTVAQAVSFFDQVPAIWRKIEMLEAVGLGYLKLGQSAVTLSGGEAQRVKLSNELSRRGTGKSLYVLDEPTTGLHFDDIGMLLSVLDKLVDQGNTVIVIEHNLDVVKCADYIIDLGPENGEEGGRVVAEGTPEQVVRKGEGHTAQWLSRELNRKPKKK